MTCEKKKTEPRVLLLIANPKLARKAAAMFDTARVPFQYQFHGLGTASSEIMETLGLGSIEKTILMCVLPRILADEVLTPDSSRFWPGDEYAEGKDQPSFDKQFVRDWLNANWDRQGNPPRLPQEVIEKTSEKYIQAYETITGRKFR